MGGTDYFHRSVVCGTIGRNPHVILGQEMLTPRDGGEKDEGELTGGKRLVKELHRKFGQFVPEGPWFWDEWCDEEKCNENLQG